MKYLLPFHTLLGANDPWTLKFYSSLGCAFFTLFVTLEYVISTLKSNGSLAGIRFFFSFSRFFTRLDLNVCAIFMMPGCGYDVLNGGKTLHIFFVTFGQIFLSDLLHVCTASLRLLCVSLSPFSSLFHIQFLEQKNSFRFVFILLSAELHISRFLYYIFGTVGTKSMQNNWVRMEDGKSCTNQLIWWRCNRWVF